MYLKNKAMGIIYTVNYQTQQYYMQCSLNPAGTWRRNDDALTAIPRDDHRRHGAAGNMQPSLSRHILIKPIQKGEKDKLADFTINFN